MLIRHSALALLSVLALTGVACSQSTSSDVEESSAAVSAPESAATLITISPDLPFEVAGMHPATGRIFTARWGQHGGPIATLGTSAGSPRVTRWFLPGSPTAPAASHPITAALVPDVPSDSATFLWNDDGFVETSHGALMSWKVSSGNATGELIQFSADYDAITSRGFVNGYYAGTSFGSRLVYSGLSGITATAEPETRSAGLWANDFTAQSIVPATPTTKLLAWEGTSGPVTTDGNGNVFAAAYLASGNSQTDTIYALGKSQSAATEPQTAATLAEVSGGGGTSTLAAASATGSNKGWVFAKGWDGDQPKSVYARAYGSTADAVTAEGEVIADAIKPVAASTTLSMFGDPQGNLWVTITADTGSWLVQLAPK